MYIEFELINDKDRERSHFFNAFFYKKLTSSEDSYQSLKNWTNNVNIFEKDFIIVPINER